MQEVNHHKLYLALIDALVERELFKQLLATSYRHAMPYIAFMSSLKQAINMPDECTTAALPMILCWRVGLAIMMCVQSFISHTPFVLFPRTANLAGCLACAEVLPCLVNHGLPSGSQLSEGHAICSGGDWGRVHGRYIRILLASEHIKTKSGERSLLRNLGSWLGRLTMGKQQPVRQKDLDLKKIIYEAYEQGKMIAVLPFVVKVRLVFAVTLAACVCCKQFPGMALVKGCLYGERMKKPQQQMLQIAWYLHAAIPMHGLCRGPDQNGPEAVRVRQGGGGGGESRAK